MYQKPDSAYFSNPYSFSLGTKNSNRKTKKGRQPVELSAKCSLGFSKLTAD